MAPTRRASIDVYARPSFASLDMYTFGIALDTLRTNVDALAADLDTNREPV